MTAIPLEVVRSALPAKHAPHFNLVVRADSTAPMFPDRMFEDTTSRLKEAYSLPSSGPDLIALSQLPTVLVLEFEEGDVKACAVLGYMDEPSMNPQITRPVFTFPAQTLFGSGVLKKWGNTRTRWRVVEGDPFRAFASHAFPPEPASSFVESNLVAVMMPFAGRASEDPVYSGITKAAHLAGF